LTPRTVVLAITYLISLASLLWTLREVAFSALLSDLSQLHPLWIALAITSMLSVYFAQGLRWRLILAPVANLPWVAATRAVYVGLFASEVFPFRAGEIIRCYLAARWTALPFSVGIASVLIERLFDGILMWLGIRYALRAVHVPEKIQLLADGLGAVVLVGVIVLGVALFRPRLQHASMPASGWRKRWFVLQEDLALIGHSRYLWAALLATVPYLLLQVVPVYILFREYEFPLGFSSALALMMLIRLAAALPQPPATLGLFQLLTKEFLELGFGIASDEAARFSLVLWAVIKIPILIAGAVAVAVTGMKVSELTKAAREAQS
jgi:uncharacterized membrane protein YbhN (UPF0104 family)